jgi:hypothetical protein
MTIALGNEPPPEAMTLGNVRLQRLRAEFRKLGEANIGDDGSSAYEAIVRVLDQSTHRQLLSGSAGPSLPTNRRRKKESRADRIIAIYYAIPENEKAKWKTKTKAAWYIRDLLDGRGSDRDRRRHVLEVLNLEEDFAARFPDSPDGVSEK